MHGTAELTHLQSLQGQNSSSTEFRAKRDESEEKISEKLYGKGPAHSPQVNVGSGQYKIHEQIGREALNPLKIRSNKNNKMLS